MADAIEFSGVGGYEMAAEGMPSLFRIDELAIVGFAAIPQRLPMIIKRIRQTWRAAIAARPDVMVIIDSPDFTHRVARRVRRANPSIPIVDYVSPSVWAWRPGRARAMRRYIDHVLALLPFEPEAHRKLGGPPCTYVGHPLVEQIDELRPNADEASRRGIADRPILLVLPGSRRGEIKRLTEPFQHAVERIAKHIWPIDIVIPTTPHLADAVMRETANWPLRPKVVVEARGSPRGVSARARRARKIRHRHAGTCGFGRADGDGIQSFADGSGHRAASHHGVRRRSSPISCCGENVVPEFIQEDCTPQKLADALLPLFRDSPERRRQVEAFRKLDAIMEIGKVEPARHAAADRPRGSRAQARPGGPAFIVMAGPSAKGWRPAADLRNLRLRTAS